MPQYHFNVYDGIEIIDFKGTELTDVQAARVEALKHAGALIADAEVRGDLGEEWRLEVTDEFGLVLFRMDFLVSNAPASPKPSRLS